MSIVYDMNWQTAHLQHRDWKTTLEEEQGHKLGQVCKLPRFQVSHSFYPVPERELRGQLRTRGPMIGLNNVMEHSSIEKKNQTRTLDVMEDSREPLVNEPGNAGRTRTTDWQDEHSTGCILSPANNSPSQPRRVRGPGACSNPAWATFQTHRGNPKKNSAKVVRK
jgi:hypothetical protein